MKLTLSFSGYTDLQKNIDSTTTFNSQFALNKFQEQKLTIPSKSFLINNAIEIKNHKDNPVKTEGTFKIISIAHFRPQKDYHTLFKACSLLQNRGIDFELTVLGHLYDQSWPFELIKEYQLENKVIMLGFKDNIHEYIRSSNLVVLSSLWEGTPNALLEAYANKLPVVSSNIDGCRELINASNGGFLFETQNPNDLCDRLTRMIKLPIKERELMGMNGYNHVVENYEKSKVYARWEKIIEQALNR